MLHRRLFPQNNLKILFQQPLPYPNVLLQMMVEVTIEKEYHVRPRKGQIS